MMSGIEGCPGIDEVHTCMYSMHIHRVHTCVCRNVFNTPQDGRTPFLHFCARYGMQEPLKLAISAGSTIDATDAVSTIKAWSEFELS